MIKRIYRMQKYMDELGDDMEGMTLHQVSRYHAMREAGESHNMAEMLALRTFPGVRGTDSVFMQGTHCQDDPIDQYRYAVAQASGVDTSGKRYLPSLAAYPNDPQAWVSGLDDVARVCSARGYNCHGALEYSAPAPTEPPPPDPKIAPDIVKYHMEACLRAFDPSEITPALVDDIRDNVTRELTGEIKLDDTPHVQDWNHEDLAEIEGVIGSSD